jgi:hypothetical protein
MWFWLFQKACRKYHFNFTLNTHGGLKLILSPSRLNIKHNFEAKYRRVFDSIEVTECHFRYGKLFRKAIKEMKKYYN